jgi:hypothetical protein
MALTATGHLLLLDIYCRWPHIAIGLLLQMATYCNRLLTANGYFMSLAIYCRWPLSDAGHLLQMATYCK